ncbi:MAG: tRNA lysidine(34) synthetase TilS [Planctomycetota bacterium]
MRSVARGLRRKAQTPEGASILVAVSGGADSVCLLRSLTLLAPRRRWRHRLVVAHIHHGLRGADADRDAEFAEHLADTLGLAFTRRDLQGLADQPGNLQASARQARYAALHHLAQTHRCGFVAVGHHADDQLETMLLRLIRGAGPVSFGGMAWARPIEPNAQVRLIRPMLAVDPADARTFLQKLDQNWREDPTNHNADRQARARLRRDVLPALKALHPGAAQNAVRLADRLRGLSR